MKTLVAMFAVAGLLNGVTTYQTIVLSMENHELREQVASLRVYTEMSLYELGQVRV